LQRLKANERVVFSLAVKVYRQFLENALRLLAVAAAVHVAYRPKLDGSVALRGESPPHEGRFHAAQERRLIAHGEEVCELGGDLPPKAKRDSTLVPHVHRAHGRHADGRRLEPQLFAFHNFHFREVANPFEHDGLGRCAVVEAAFERRRVSRRVARCEREHEDLERV
jgi:hypothetical protein